MTRVTIFERNIDDELWLKLILVMTYVKNNQPIKALENYISLHKAYIKEVFNLIHVQIFSSTVYVLLQEEKCLIKSEK